MQTMTRRTFLKSLTGSCAMAFLPTLPYESINLPSPITRYPVPPSLMLHSPHGKGDILARLLDAIHTQGFTATTYQAWWHSIERGSPIPNPLIISIDDLTLSKDVAYAWETFSKMKETIQAAGMVATYGVITEPIINGLVCTEQDGFRWDLMVDWVRAGFELASHTAHHSVFGNKHSEARRDFDTADYEAEICDSAETIEIELAARGVHYDVKTLILPFGSGYSYSQPNPKFHDGIVAACEQTNIRMVVGIPQGREPLSSELVREHEMAYLGRMQPLVSADSRYDVAATINELVRWAELY